MDPQACWEVIKDILDRGTKADWDMDDQADLVELLENLAQWIKRGGFWPKP